MFAQASMLFLFPEVASKVCKPRVRGLFIDDPEQWATFLMKVIVRCNSFVPGCLTSGYLSAKEVTMMIQQAHVILSNPNERDASKMTLCTISCQCLIAMNHWCRHQMACYSSKSTPEEHSS